MAKTIPIRSSVILGCFTVGLAFEGGALPAMPAFATG
jgi:hypothetical protein